MKMQGFVLDKTASHIFNILTDYSLELGDVFPPYKEIIINNGRHCFLKGDARFFTIKVTLSHCIPLTQKEIFPLYREII
jgi:hypothetical protein